MHVEVNLRQTAERPYNQTKNPHLQNFHSSDSNIVRTYLLLAAFSNHVSSNSIHCCTSHSGINRQRVSFPSSCQLYCTNSLLNVEERRLVLRSCFFGGTASCRVSLHITKFTQLSNSSNLFGIFIIHGAQK